MSDLKLTLKPKFLAYDEASGAAQVQPRPATPAPSTPNFAAIHCPKCNWEPKPTSRWGCSCGHAWNTFDTRGKCPACGEQWKDTACLGCKEWSPHEAWYLPFSAARVASALDDDVIALIQGGNKIAAIKLHRERSGLGLREAKDAVDAWQAPR